VKPLLLADNFESNTFAAWTEVDQEGDASATISTVLSVSGNCAGKLVVTTAGTSRAFITKDLGGNKTDVWASGSFNVTQEGLAGSNVPYLRFFDGAGRIVEVMRSNDDQKAWLGVTDGIGGRTYIPLNILMPLNEWHQVTLHAAPNAAGGATSTVQVWIDGSSVYSQVNVDVHTTKLTKVQLGNEFVSQQMIEYFDDITIGAS
jgi:hypothetical protein